MKNDKTPLHLRTLCIGSWIALSLSLFLPIIAKIEGEESNVAITFSYLFAGLIGISAYEVSSRLYKRVVALETKTATQRDDTDHNIES
jgi:Na+/melibiose symporter-like transporter